MGMKKTMIFTEMGDDSNETEGVVRLVKDGEFIMSDGIFSETF
jgi:hypothetical protein